jgi:integrase/plasmid stabilization system protein ParE
MVEHLHKEKRSGIFRYRRRVPPDLQGVLGKKMFDISLKTKDPEAARRERDKVHREIEALLAKASSGEPDQREYEETMRILKDGKVIRRGATSSPPKSIDTNRAYGEMIVERIAKMSPEAQEAPLEDAPRDLKLMLRAMRGGMKKPELRLRDAVTSYLDEKSTKFSFKDMQKQTGLVMAALEEVVGQKNPALIDITLNDAYAFRDHWIKAKGLTASTAQRRLNTIKAIFNFAIKRHQITGYINPFAGVEVKGANANAKDRMDALTIEEIRLCEPHVARSNQDIRDVWALLMFTGARPKEITTLEKQDVILDHPVPHIIIRENALWRVKVDSSTRKVPLVGQALEIAQRRLGDLEGKPGGTPFIARYSREGGAGAAGSLLTKAMKAAGVWQRQKKVPYSLRHSVKDWVRRVASELHSDMIHGHGGGSISRAYGSDDMLDILRDKLTEALVKAGVMEG